MRPRTHLPKPYQAPSISLSTTVGAKKRWVTAHPATLKPGDIIQGKGLIVAGQILERRDAERDMPFLVVSFEMKSGDRISYRAYIGPHYDAKEQGVKAFTEAEGEPVG